MKRAFPILTILIVMLSLVASGAQVSAAANVDGALGWLRGQQQPDGGYLGFTGGSDAGTTTDVALAFAAAGINPGSVSHTGTSMLDFLTTSAATYGGTTGGAAKLALAAAASGANPRSFGGVNLIERIKGAASPQSGLMDQQLYVHALAVLALSAAGEPIPATAVTALIDRQIADGSWAFTGSTDAGQGDSNTTAVVIQALAAAGQGSSQAVQQGLGYLTAAATPQGAVTYQAGKENPPVGDANSTALAIQAMLASGGDPSSGTVAAATTALSDFQNPSGAFFFRSDAKDDNLLSTAQAIPALAGKPLPILAPSNDRRTGLPSVAPQTGNASASGWDSLIMLGIAGVALAVGFGFRAGARRRAGS